MINKNYPIPERKWAQITMEPPRQSLNPMQPQMLLVAIVAQRSDGLWIKAEGGIPVDKLRLIPSAQAGLVEGLKLTQNLLNHLETYRNCECQEGKPCKKHGGGEPS